MGAGLPTVVGQNQEPRGEVQLSPPRKTWGLQKKCARQQRGAALVHGFGPATSHEMSDQMHILFFFFNGMWSDDIWES